MMSSLVPWPPGFLGGARGPLTRARPPVRLLCGGATILAALLAPRELGAGAVFNAGLGVAMVLAAGAPVRLVRRVLRFGVVIYLPLALLLIGGAAATGEVGAGAALAAAAAIAVKGCVVLLIALSTLATIGVAELHPAVAGLPLPALARLILLQIVQQTGVLLGETARIRQAIAFRAPARSRTATLRVALAFQRVWLERVWARAERTALGLEVRGYVGHGAAPLPPLARWGYADTLAMLASALALGGGVVLRYLG